MVRVLDVKTLTWAVLTPSGDAPPARGSHSVRSRCIDCVPNILWLSSNLSKCTLFEVRCRRMYRGKEEGILQRMHAGDVGGRQGVGVWRRGRCTAAAGRRARAGPGGHVVGDAEAVGPGPLPALGAHRRGIRRPLAAGVWRRLAGENTRMQDKQITIETCVSGRDPAIKCRRNSTSDQQMHIHTVTHFAPISAGPCTMTTAAC
jgi:hypothetical protein